MFATSARTFTIGVARRPPPPLATTRLTNSTAAVSMSAASKSWVAMIEVRSSQRWRPAVRARCSLCAGSTTWSWREVNSSNGIQLAGGSRSSPSRRCWRSTAERPACRRRRPDDVRHRDVAADRRHHRHPAGEHPSSIATTSAACCCRRADQHQRRARRGGPGRCAAPANRRATDRRRRCARRAANRPHAASTLATQSAQRVGTMSSTVVPCPTSSGSST